MKVSTHHKAANVFGKPTLRPVPMQRAHTDHLDSFHRQSHGRPQHRRTHSAPRVPLAHARPKPAADVKATAVRSKPKCANTLGASFSTKMRGFASKVLDATLVFALWMVDMLIEVGMDRVGQHFRPDALATVA